MISRLHALGLGGSAALAVLLACSSDAPTAPETTPTVALASPLSGAVRAGTAQTVSLLTPANAPLLLYADGRGGNPGDSLLLVLGTPDGSGELGRLAFSPVDGAETPRGLYVTAFPVETRLPLTVRGLRASDAGRYELRVAGPTNRPEHGDAQMALDTDVVEQHDGPSDIDIFQLPVAAGMRYILLVGKRGFTEPRGITIAIRDGNGPLAGRTATRADHEPEEWVVPFIPRIDGEVSISVTGPAGPTSWYGGSYSLRVITASRAPETAPSTIALNDTIADAIDMVGDIDEYTFSGVAGTTLRLWPRLERDLAAPVTFSLYRGTTLLRSVSTSTASSWGDGWPSDPLTLPATDTYRVEVVGPLDRLPDASTSPYAFVLTTTTDAPEHAPSALAPGALVTEETLFGCADIDEFTIQPTTATRLAVGIARTTAEGCALRFEVRLGTSPINSGVLTTATSDPDQHRLTRVAVEPGQTLTVRVWADRFLTPTGGVTPYVLDVYEVNEGPEDAPATFVPDLGSFTETLDRCGDEDAFTFDVAEPGQLMLNFGLDRPVGCPGTIDITNTSFGYSTSRTVAVMPSGDPDATAAAVPLPWAGRYRLTWRPGVRGPAADRGAALTVAHQFLSRQPELVPATTTIDAVITGETIARCGDIDEFRFTAVAGDEVRIGLALDRDVSCDVTAQLFYFDQLRATVTTRRAAPLDSTRSGVASLVSSGEYTLRISSTSSGSSADRGTPYEVGVFRPDARPETVPDTLVVGDSISSEGIEVPGDRDDFYVYLETGREYAVNVAGNVRLTVFGAFASVNPANPLLPMGIRSTGLFGVDSSAYYRMRFQGATEAATTPYAFEIIESVLAPELSPPELPLGTWVTETLDPFFDRDQFFVRSDPRDWLLVSAERVGSAGTLTPESYPFATFAPDGRSLPFQGFSDSTAISIRGLLYDPATNRPGAYRLRVDVIDPSPEQLPPTFAVGDTIRGEALGFIGDVDRFTSTVAEAGNYRMSVRGTAGCPATWGFIWILEAPGTYLFSGGFSNWSTHDFSVAAADPVTVTFHSSNVACQTGAYEFVLTRLP